MSNPGTHNIYSVIFIHVHRWLELCYCFSVFCVLINFIDGNTQQQVIVSHVKREPRCCQHAGNQMLRFNMCQTG